MLIKQHRIALLFLLIGVFLNFSCDGNKLQTIPIDQFIGKWKISQRGMLDDIHIEIRANEQGELSGKIISLNTNKYINLFMEENDELIVKVKRKSNYEFLITERRIAAPLFALYKQSTTEEYTVSFEDTNKFVIVDKGMKGTFTRTK